VELLLIRHALPERIDPGNGPADPGLSPEGARQAQALAEWLVPEGPDAIYTSPLRRARETATPLVAATGHDAVVDERVTEFDRDFDFYIPMEEMKAENHPHWQAMTEGRFDDFPTDIVGFGRTVVDALDSIATAHPGQRVAVVCHGGVINAYTGRVIGTDRPLFFEPGYTSISRVLVSRDRVRSIVSLNETAHLRTLA
jgi:probable phosphoglycerate mutase